MIAQLELGTAPALGLSASPALIQFSHTLGLPAAGLEELVERELAGNPALERRPSLDGAGSALPAVEDAAAGIADQPSDADLLLAAVRLALPACEHGLAEAIVDGLTSRGFLPAPPERIAEELGVAPARVADVVAALRDAGPPGTAAAGVRECLLAQLDAIDEPGERFALARAIVADHLEDLAAGRLGAIAHAVRVSVRDVGAARELIRRRLRPCVVMERPSGRRSVPAAPMPELAFRPSGRGGHDVEVLEATRFALRISPLYSDVAFSGGPREAAAAGGDLRRAHAFLDRLEERWRTLRAVGEALALHQDAFLRHGAGLLVPLTRAELAREIGVHESTVSRAVADKHAALPGGGVMALSGFFTTSHDALDALRALVACEPRPLPDGALADALRRRGFPVARRTVAKYRGLLGIPPAGLRGDQLTRA